MITMEQKRQALKQIADANDGIVTPEAVVRAAKDPRHILNQIFDWDINRAAHKHWLDTARDLIRSVEVVVEYEDVVTTAVSYVHDVRAGRKGQGYVSIDALARRQEDARQTILLELERVQAAIERARAISGSLGLADYFEQILRNVLAARLRIRRGGGGGGRRRAA